MDNSIRLLTASLLLYVAGAPTVSSQETLDVQVQSLNGRLVIGAGEVDEDTFGISDPTLSVNIGTRVFTEVLGTNFGSSNPGFNIEPTGSPFLLQNGVDTGIRGIGEGAQLFVDFVPTTINGVTSNFFFWDGADSNNDGEITSLDVNFNAPTTGQTFGIAPVTPFVSVDGAAEVVAGGLIDTTSIFEPITNLAGGRLHRHHPVGVLNAIGVPSSNQPDGIYVVALQARVDGFKDSDPFFWVFESRDFAATPSEQGELAEFVATFLDENFDDFAHIGDLNDDFTVDAADFTIFRDHNGAGFADPLEGFDRFARNFDSIPLTGAAAVTAALAVPEPATMMSLACGLAGLALTIRRR